MAIHWLLSLAGEPRATLSWLTLLLTYSAHAFLWAGAAALLARRKSMSSSTRHLVWRLTLLGPFATTLFAAGLGDMPAREVRVLSLGRAAVPAPAESAGPKGERIRPSAEGEVGTRRAPAGTRLPLVNLCVIGAGVVGLLRFTASGLLLWWSLRERRKVEDPRWVRRFERMRRRLGLRHVALTESADVGSPVVLGVSEICVPRATLGALSDAEIDAVLAHELAHLERRDGLWFPIVGLVQSVLWVQPTNAWAAPRFRESAELACDERAVEITGDPRSLARALLHVAEGGLRFRRGSMIPTMARSASTLSLRVKRLAGARDRAAFPLDPSGRRWAIAGLVAIATATAGSSVRVARARSAEPAPVAAAPAPHDPAELSRRMADLVYRERELEAELIVAQSLSDAHIEGTPASTHVLDLQQELRHVRAVQAWTEDRFSGEGATLDDPPRARTTR